jgi:predicted ATP-binding protein involved in virulence
MALKNIQKAVNIALRPSGWENPEWDFAEDCIIATHPEQGRLPVDFLSDGIRNMIGLVSDIAHRAYRLNSHFKDMAAEKSPGIVLIDEVDIHLHPQWQQLVLNTLMESFHKIQFIVTTHSPQVLTTIRKENIHILNIDSDGKCTTEMPEKSPLAQESGFVLADIMNVHPRPDIPDIISKTHDYEQLILAGRGDSEEATAIKEYLEKEGYEFSDAVKAKFEFLKKRLKNKE